MTVQAQPPQAPVQGAIAHPWLVPQWPPIEGVHALFTTRQGGVGRAPFDSLNLGDHVRDDPVHVAANRRILADAIARTSLSAHVQPVFLQQVHGCEVLRLEPGCADGSAADACVTSQPGVACTAMVADCLPVLMAHQHLPVVAAAHAGWRGLVGHGGVGVLEQTFRQLAAAVLALQAPGEGALRASDIPPQALEDVARHTQVWLGPCIGPAAFEVGDEVRAAFMQASAGAAACFRAGAQPGKWWADLPALARQRLHAMGLTQCYGNDGSAAWCTVSQPAQFFSHRRDAARLGSTGRMAACIWLA